jgi:hypothetical protein
MWRFLVGLYKAARTESWSIFNSMHFGKLKYCSWVISPKFTLSWSQLAHKRIIVFFDLFAAAFAEQLPICG